LNASVLLFLNLGGGEVFVIILVMLMFFGSDKLPGIAKGLGKGLRELNDAKAQITEEITRGTEGFTDEIRKHTSEVQAEITKAQESVRKQIDKGAADLNDQGNQITDTFK
jgi:sec-independent protein translocase protein TatA